MRVVNEQIAASPLAQYVNKQKPQTQNENPPQNNQQNDQQNNPLAQTTNEPSSSSAPSSTESEGSDGGAGPLISFNFDDSWASAYEHARPIMNAAGFKVTNYVITHYMGIYGYMSKEQILQMQSEGHEIGAHTRTHAHLTQIPESEAREEIHGSRQDLLDIGVNSVETFAYPYGEHNDSVRNMVREAGFVGARGVADGFNDKATDRMLLYSVDASMPFSETRAMIDRAEENGKWLILIFHHVNEDGKYQNASSDLVRQIVDYVKSKNIRVVTNSEGLRLMGDIE